LYDAASNQEIISDVAANYSRKLVSVTLFDRTILRDGNWNTLCLPFAIANIDADNCPLTGATVHELNSASISGTTLTLNFLEATKTIKAGTPYIVRWETEDDDIVSPVFSGVRVSTETHNYDNLASGSNNVCFTGTYRNTAFGNAYGSVLLMDRAKLPYYPQIGATVGACRAYFSIGDENSPSLMLTDINLSFGYDPTGITSISSETDTQAEACYSLSGMKLNKQPSKGIFIQNGRKVVIL